jgi:hypothetical protein
MNSRPQLLPVFVLSAAGLFAATPRAAQAQEPVCPGFREMAEAAVPTTVGDREVMRRLLAPTVGPQLSQTFDPAALAKNVGDELQPDPACQREGSRPCIYRNPSQGSLLYFKLRDGRATYLNPSRRFAGARGVENPTTEAQAQRTTALGLAALGLPHEVGRLDIRALMAATQDTQLLTPTQVLRAEVHVNITRQVGGVPVVGSRSMAAISSDNQIARLYVEWPDFALVPGLALEGTRARRAVVDSLVEKIAADNPCGTVGRVLAQIAYVPVSFLAPAGESNAGTNESKPRGYVPALSVFVVPPEVRDGRSGLAEQQVFIPLVGPTATIGG